MSKAAYALYMKKLYIVLS